MRIAAIIAVAGSVLASPAVGQNESKIVGAFGVTLGEPGENLEALGFVKKERLESGVKAYTWTKFDDPFFDVVSADAQTGTTTVDGIGAYKYYDKARPFVDLSACESDFNGLVQTIHEKYPSLVEIDRSDSSVNKRLYKHVKTIVFGSDSKKWDNDRSIYVECDSGSLADKKPVPSLSVTYSLSIWEMARMYNEEKARVQRQARMQAKAQVETKGLDPDKL